MTPYRPLLDENGSKRIPQNFRGVLTDGINEPLRLVSIRNWMITCTVMSWALWKLGGIVAQSRVIRTESGNVQPLSHFILADVRTELSW